MLVGGDDCQDTPRLFYVGQADKGDLPRVADLAQGRAESHPLERDRVPLRTIAATSASGLVPGESGLKRCLRKTREQDAPRTADAHPDIAMDLRDLGYEGSYAAVRRYAIAWREKRASAATADAYVLPAHVCAGRGAYQFDWMLFTRLS